MKRTFFLIKAVFILLLTASASYADLPVLNSSVNMYTAWASDPYNGLRTLNSFGQSFVATAPFLKSVGFNSADPSGTAVITIYAFGSDSDPKGTTTGIYQLPIVGTASIAQFGQSVCSSWTVNGLPVATPFLNVGSTYYLEITNQNGGTLELGFSYNNSYGSGRAFNNGAISGNDDLNLKIIGGYPSFNDNQVLLNCKVWENGNNAWNAVSNTSMGQSFIATSPFINNISINNGSTTGKYVATIYEFGTTQQPVGVKVGESCFTTTNVQYNTVLFDWVGSQVAPVHLKVGKKYYVEFQIQSQNDPNTFLPIHVYGSIADDYSLGESYSGRAIFQGDLNIIINGSDLNINEETIFREGRSAYYWLNPATSAGQTFLATTNYVNEISLYMLFPVAAQLYIQIFEFGTDNSPEGKLIAGTPNGSDPNFALPSQLLSGNVVCHFPPVKLDLGKTYYVKFLINGNQSFQVTTGRQNTYSYAGTTYGRCYINGSIYKYQNTDVTLNMEIKGFLAGFPYLGFLTSITSYGEDATVYNNLKSYGAHHWVRVDVIVSSDGYLTQWDNLVARTENTEFGGIIGLIHVDPSVMSPSSAATTQRIQALINKYKSKHIIWELWNEPPDPSGAFPNFPTDYIQLVKNWSQTIKAIDPNALVSTGGISGYYYDVSDKFIAGGLNSQYVDFQAYHSYFQNYPEDTLQYWLKTRKTQYVKTLPGIYNRPHLLSTEYGISFNVRETSDYCGGAPAASDLLDLPWMYRVKGANNFYQTGTSFGQIFQANSKCIRDVSVEYEPPATGNFTTVAQVYNYSNGTIGSPLISGTLPSFTVYPGDYSAHLFNFSGSPGNNNVVNLINGNSYYIEFTRPDNGSLTFAASTTDDYGAGKILLNRQATQYANNYNVDANMRINKATIFYGGSVTDNPTIPGREAGIYYTRYILTHLAQGAAGSNIYKEQEGIDENGCNDYCGVFQDFGHNSAPNPIAFGIKFISNLFGKAYNTPNFAVGLLGNTSLNNNVQIFSRINSSDGSLLVAIWRPSLSATFSQVGNEQLTISTGAYTGAVSLYSDLTAHDYSTYTPAVYTDKTLTSNKLTINNIPVSENPIILKILKQ